MKLKLSDYGYTILMIETKLVCNMRCGFCAYPLMDSIGTELPEEDVRRVIDSIDPSDSALEAIYFQKFNEPLLDKRIFGFVRYAMDRGFRVQMITNGLPLGSPEIRKKLLDAAPTNILISLQVIDRDSFNRARGISSSFEEYKKGIFAFLQESLERSSSSRITIDVACNFLSSDRFFSKTGGITKILGLDRGDPSVPDTVQEIQDDLIEFLRDLHAFNPAFAFDEQEIRNYLNTIDPNYLRQPGLPVSGNISVKVKQFIHGRKLTDFIR